MQRFDFLPDDPVVDSMIQDLGNGTYLVDVVRRARELVKTNRGGPGIESSDRRACSDNSLLHMGSRPPDAVLTSIRLPPEAPRGPPGILRMARGASGSVG